MLVYSACECGNELSGSIKLAEFFENLLAFQEML